MSINGWSRGDYTWKLIDKAIDVSCVSPKSQRKYSAVNVAKEDDELVLRTHIEIHTSGAFDCRISFARAEILLMALEALRDVPIGQLADVLTSAGEAGR